MRECEVCGIPLVHSELTIRASQKDGPVEYLTCNECGCENLLTSWIDPRPADPEAGYLLYNTRTALFDEYNLQGVLIHANIFPSPRIDFPRAPGGGWPTEKQKSKRAGDETWLDDRGFKDVGGPPGLSQF